MYLNKVSSGLSWGKFLILLCGVLAVLFHPLHDADAAKKKKRKKKEKNKYTIVIPADTFRVDLQVRLGKKMLNEEAVCFNKLAGQTRVTKKGLAFIPYSKMAKDLEKKGRQGTKKHVQYQKLAKAGKKECTNPPFLALNRYTGEFTEVQARTLYERFAFGATPAEIQAAVSRGLEATVNMLTTYQAEPLIDSYYEDLACDTYWNWDERDEGPCNPNNLNDVDIRGTRLGLYVRYLTSANSFFHRFAFWIMDERLAVDAGVLNGSERHALRKYLDSVYRAAIYGDYVQYMRDMNSDHLMNLKWLDGASNKASAPNENWAREFWELGTVGAKNPDTSPVYSTIDVAQAALAHSGWKFIYEEEDIIGEEDEIGFTYRAFADDLHSPGPHTIFNGTRWQATVYNAEDLLRATFNHPRAAEHLAEDLCLQYIRTQCPTSMVNQIAKMIRESNFNLIPVMRRIMMSKAVYDPENRKGLLKHPVDLLFGFLRSTGYPLSVDEIDRYLSEMDQVPLRAPTVFGWDEQRLAGEVYVLERRNFLLDVLSWDHRDLSEDRNYSLSSRFFTNLPADRTPSRAVIDRVAETLNVRLNQAQIDQLEQYMNYNRTRCNYWDAQQYDCTEGEYFLRRDVYDAFEGEGEYKLQGLMAMLMMLPDYACK